MIPFMIPIGKSERSRFTPPPSSLLDLGRAVRDLMVAMLQVPADDAVGRATLEATCAHVRRGTEEIRKSGVLPQPDATCHPARRPRYGFGAVVGSHNPAVPEPHVEHVDGTTRGTVTFDLPFEGPPGFVHGGFVALFFDQILGQHNMAVDANGMTGRLSVDYRQPTPLGRRLSFEVEGGRVNPRKTVTRGRLIDGDTVLAVAEGVFILPRDGMPTRVDGPPPSPPTP